MATRLIALLAALAIAAPAGLRVASAGDSMPDDMGCCPVDEPGQADEDERRDEPTISRRCCCDVDRRSPVDAPVTTLAIPAPDDAPDVAVAAVVAVDSTFAIPASTRLPPPRGPPPRRALFAQKTSFLL